MKEDKHTKRLAKNQVYAIVHMRDIRKNVLPKFIQLLYRDAMFVSLSGALFMAAGNQQKHLFLSFPTYA